MDEQSGDSKEEEVVDEGIGESEWRNWYQNEVDEDIQCIKTQSPCAVALLKPKCFQ